MINIHRITWLGLFIGISVLGFSSLGGFRLSVVKPSSTNRSALHTPVLLVHTENCGQPSKAKITGMAEGLVAGKRQSILLQLTSIASGKYAVKQQWPAQGNWVLAFTGKYRGHTSSILVKLDAKGIPVTFSIKPVNRALKKREIERALLSNGRRALN